MFSNGMKVQKKRASYHRCIIYFQKYVRKEVDGMHEHIAKHIIKLWIDNSNWSYRTKKDLKYIVDVSRTADEVALGFAMYPYWVHNCW